MQKIKFLISFLFILIHTQTFSQHFGGHPNKIKWMQINSKNVKVIYQEGLENKAYRIAGIIDHIKLNNTYSIGNKSKKINIILQTNQVISNGFVTLLPYRSEFYGTGLQNFHSLGSMEWLDALSIHEYRHALQYNNANRGFTKFLHLLQGQNGWNLGMGLSIPNWYFEGDAVLSETLLSNAGRGRTPNFFKEQKTILMANKNYSYLTARNGSYKKMIPNHYNLGFTMCNYTRNEFGMNIWKDIIADAGRYKSIIYPFSGAMKKHTGKRPKEIYKLAYQKLKKDWKNEIDTIALLPTTPVTVKQKKTVTNYEFPQILNDQSIVAIKSSFKEISYLVSIQNGIEKKLTSYGVSPEPFLSENNNRVAWTVLKKDIRRGNRNYSEIVVYDINTKSKNIVLSKSKYFSPHISSNGEKIVAIEANENLQNQIHILSTKGGNLLLKIPNPENDFLSYPKWLKGDEFIIYLAKRNSKIAFFKYDIKNKATTQLSNWTAQTIGSYDLDDNKIYFSASFTGIDNIFSVNIDGDKKIKQLTSVRIGAYEPSVSPSNGKVIFGEFSEMGQIISEIQLKNIDLIPEFILTEPINQSRYSIKTNDYEKNILDSLEVKTYKKKEYKGIFKGIKLHSWSFENEENNPKLNISLANILTNIEGNFGSSYNRNEKTTNFSENLKFGKWFTEINLDLNKLNRQVDFVTQQKIEQEQFEETRFGATLNIPLNWISNNYFYHLNPSLGYTQHITSNYKNENLTNSNLNFGSIKSEISFSTMRVKAVQNIYPKFGISLNLQNQKSIKENIAKKINLYGSLYLPGLAKNHGIKIDANWQNENSSNKHQFSDNFFYSRGYKYIPVDNATKVSLNYALPLFYPDWGFAGITYFKRVRANLFYDKSKIQIKGNSNNLNSYGSELIFDNTMFNAIPVSMGIRKSFLLNKLDLIENKNNPFEVFFNFDL